MRILMISKECASSSLAYKLAEEGNDVRFFVEDRHFKKVCNGFGVTKTNNWKKDLPWVGKDGLIVFDYTGYGKIQDDLRAEGYAVVGGSEGGEALELERDFAFRVLEESGMPTLPLYHFNTPKEAVEFIRTHPGPGWSNTTVMWTKPSPMWDGQATTGMSSIFWKTTTKTKPPWIPS